MLDLGYQDAGEARADPLLVFVVGLLLLNPVVAGQVEALRVIGLKVRVGRRGAEVVYPVDEVVMKDGEREVGVGMLVKALRHQDDGGEIHRRAPELCQHLTLDADVADVLGVGLRGDGRDDLGERHLKLGVPVDVDLGRLGVEIPGSKVPMLALAAVWRQFHHRAVGPVEGLVNVEHGLDVVIARGHVVERADGIAGGLSVHGDGLAGSQSIDSFAEDELRPRGVVDLHARLGRGIRREQQEDAPVERFRGGAGGEADGDLASERKGRGYRQQCGEEAGEVAKHR